MIRFPLFPVALAVFVFAAEMSLPAQQILPQNSLPLIDQLLDPSLADGFDFPVGGADGTGSYISKDSGKRFRGWLAAVIPNEPGDPAAPFDEAWNGSGGGDTDRGQPVFAIAAGTVIGLQETQRGQELIIEHRFLENGQLQIVRSISAGLAGIQLKQGDLVKRRQRVGVIAPGIREAPTQLYLQIQRQLPDAATQGFAEAPGMADNETPSLFIRAHRHLTVPANDPAIIIAIKHAYLIHLCSHGKIVKSLPMALSQAPLGGKTNSGDNRTPEGEYRVTQKAEGPFEGAYAEYLGDAWIRLNYPNTADAQKALAEKRITRREYDAIALANAENRMPSPETSLGGGIGIHGWATDWPEGPQNLTWGCLSLRSADLKTLYGLVKKGTRVIIHP